MSTKEKMISCKHCGAEIAANAPVCPHCGGKNKKPLYKRPWFLVLAVLVILGGLGAAGGQEKDTGTSQTVPGAAVQEEITYTAADVSQLMVTLNQNALAAAEEYKGQYLEVTGRLAVIDSSGEYITLLPEDDSFAFVGVQCYLQNQDQKDAVMKLAVGDTVTVQGKVTDVGEVLGYSLKVDEILTQDG